MSTSQIATYVLGLFWGLQCVETFVLRRSDNWPEWFENSVGIPLVLGRLLVSMLLVPFLLGFSSIGWWLGVLHLGACFAWVMTLHNDPVKLTGNFYGEHAHSPVCGCGHCPEPTAER